MLRHSEFHGRAISKAQNETEWNLAKKLSFTEQSKYRTKLLLTRVMETNSYGLYKNSQFEYVRDCCCCVLLSCFLFCGMVWNGIPRVCLYFCSMEQISELFSLPLQGSEGNSESLLLILVHGTEFWVVFSFAKGFGTEFQSFSVPRNSRNFVGNNHLFHIFRLPRNCFFVGNSQP